MQVVDSRPIVTARSVSRFQQNIQLSINTSNTHVPEYPPTPHNHPAGLSPMYTCNRKWRFSFVHIADNNRPSGGRPHTTSTTSSCRLYIFPRRIRHLYGAAGQRRNPMMTLHNRAKYPKHVVRHQVEAIGPTHKIVNSREFKTKSFHTR